MTRQDFIDNVTTWGELLDFCNEEGSEICEDIFTEEERDQYITDNWLMDWARESSWWDLYQILDGIVTGYDYYELDDGEFYSREDGDTTFEERKQEVLQWMDSGDWWDTDDEEEELEDDLVYEEIDCDDLEPIEDEDISVTDLFNVCNEGLKEIANKQEEDILEENNIFDKFFSELVVNNT